VLDMGIERQRQQYEQRQVEKVRQMLEHFAAEEQQVVAVVEGRSGRVEAVSLGEPEGAEAIAPIANRGLEQLQELFGGRLADAMPGLKLYFADGVIEGGGEAIPRANAVILGATKAQMTVQEAEAMGVEAGTLREGDWTKLAGPDATYGEITAVHEVAHMLAAKRYGDENAAFDGKVDPEQALPGMVLPG